MNQMNVHAKKVDLQLRNLAIEPLLCYLFAAGRFHNAEYLYQCTIELQYISLHSDQLGD